MKPGYCMPKSCSQYDTGAASITEKSFFTSQIASLTLNFSTIRLVGRWLMLATLRWNRNQVYSSVTQTLRWRERHIVNQALDCIQWTIVLNVTTQTLDYPYYGAILYKSNIWYMYNIIKLSRHWTLSFVACNCGSFSQFSHTVVIVSYKNVDIGINILFHTPCLNNSVLYIEWPLQVQQPALWILLWQCPMSWRFYNNCT